MIRSMHYNRPAIALHWLMALLIASGFSLGFYMADLKFSPEKLKLYSYHKWIGVTLFTLAIARLAWRIRHPAPPLPASLPRWQAECAGAVHIALYLLMFAIPIAGWTYSSAAGVPTVPFGIGALQLPDLVAKNKELADTLKFLHRSLAYGLAALVSLHVAAAVGHQLVDDHNILSRMLPGGGKT